MTPTQKAFLDLIAWSEGTSRSPITVNRGYDVIVSGPSGPEIFTDYSDHPFARGRTAKLVRIANASLPALYSTASGRYQLMVRWWRSYQPMLKLPDFSPEIQDAVALRQIQERGAIPLIESGDVEGAIKLCSNLWASLPGNDYGQGGNTMEALLQQYQTFNS